MNNYITTIGLEVHAQLNTKSKMFCACPATYGEPPNTLTCPTCLGLPGALPVLNDGAIELTILTGLMLGCEINPISKWDRKNYFYPDMPKNYQTTQFDLPLCVGGGVPLSDLAYPKDHQKDIAEPGKVVKMERIHLEEDVGKSTHHANSTTIDFNRAGTPLMEIVSQPDIDSAEEAVAYINSLRQILIYGGVAEADMDKGMLRADVNISVRPEGQDELNTRVELKNLNSTNAIRRAIHHEVGRQTAEMEAGRSIPQATWRWNDEAGITEPMRSKENAHDYRYFPCPDLLSIDTSAQLARAQERVPELPHEKETRFVEEFDITPYDASVLSSEQVLATYFEEAVKGDAPPKKIANWVINNILGYLNENDLGIEENPVKPAQLQSLVALVEAGTVSNNQAKEVFAKLAEDGGGDPAEVAKAMGFEPADAGEIDAHVEAVLAENPDVVAEIKGGNPKAGGFLVGQVMKRSGGKANPKQVNELIAAKLSS